ncbi:MAG: KAP family NTPase [Gammaproteobacteria bacterium]|nr:KAP family NTPase [Gammaproteobacteria bacterium]
MNDVDTPIKEEKSAVDVRVADISIPKYESEESRRNKWSVPHDQLGRGEVIETLSKLIMDAKAPMTLSVNSPWGGGKTTFIRMWESYLEYKGQTSLYLNAWENDYSEDPLLPLLLCIDRWISNKNANPAVQQTWEKVKELVPSVMKTTLVAGVKFATSNALDLSKLLEGLASDASGEVTKTLVDSFKHQVFQLDKFKGLLDKIIEELPKNQKNLVIFIDELDRCRPDFSIALLERIKHLFGLSRVVFVLAIHRDQLARSVEGVYGHNFDGHGYLERFFDFEFQLTYQDLKMYTKDLLNKEDIRDRFKSENIDRFEFDCICFIIAALGAQFSYQPRAISKLIIRLKLIVLSTSKNNRLWENHLIAMLFIRQENTELYKEWLDKGSCDGLNLNNILFPDLSGYNEEERTYINHFLELLNGVETDQLSNLNRKVFPGTRTSLKEITELTSSRVELAYSVTSR